MSSPVCPVTDCQRPIDVVLRSSDGELIGSHKANLEHFSEGFPSADAVTDSHPTDPVDLSESTKTLNDLLQFMHKRSYPDITTLGETELFALVSAPEKYIVHSAMALCAAIILYVGPTHQSAPRYPQMVLSLMIFTVIIYLRFRIKEFPIGALAHAGLYGYRNIADAAGPLVRTCESEEMKKRLDPTTFHAWLQFKMMCLERIDRAISNSPQVDPFGWIKRPCMRLKEFIAMLENLKNFPSTSHYLMTTFDGTLVRSMEDIPKQSTQKCKHAGNSHEGGCCTERFRTFVETVKDAVNDCPTLGSFL